MTRPRHNIFKIGITGNTCTGKTIVRNALSRFGVSTMDADETAMQMLADNPYRLAVRLTEHFGGDIVDNRGRLSRKKLTALIYTDPEKRAIFDEKLGPVTREEVKRFLYGAMGHQLRAVESTMLLEMDMRHLYDEVWVVTVPQHIQLARLMHRDRLSEAEARHIIDYQWGQNHKIALGDRVIDNSGDIQQTETTIRRMLDEITHKLYKVRF